MAKGPPVNLIGLMPGAERLGSWGFGVGAKDGTIKGARDAFFPQGGHGEVSGRNMTKRLASARKGKTDWRRVRALRDDDVERAVASDPDSNVINPDWAQARLVLPQRKESVHLRLDSDVLAWFRSQGRGHLTRINAVLRNYMEAHAHRQK
ncbi:MAG TPA: BrnA antitoxin family protein [Terriglobales bacterium]|nr:BrnA antitoxin family protein [Terriglobales bacterium]